MSKYPASPAGRHLTRNIRGMMWMTLSGVLFAVANASLRLAADEMHPLEMVFWRNLFGVFVVLPLIWRAGLAHFKTHRLGFHALRGGLQTASQACWFVAVTLIPMTDATALTYTAPIFASIGAILFFGEPHRFGRWLAIGFGLAGALLILRPGFAEINIGALLALGSGPIFGGAKVTNKSLSRTESSSTVIVYMTAIMTPLSLVPALFVWTWPSLIGYGWAAFIALFMTLGLWCMSQAYREGDLSAVEPFSFSILIFAAIAGFVAFSEVPIVWTWVGAAIIGLGGVILVRAEAGPRAAAG